MVVQNGAYKIEEVNNPYAKHGRERLKIERSCKK